MNEKFKMLSKEERLYIIAAVFFFAGFSPSSISDSTVWLLLQVMNLSEDEIKKTSMPDYDLMISHVRENSDEDIQSWIINNTYRFVLKSNRTDASLAFQTFLNDLNWDKKNVRNSMRLCEELNS